MKRKNRQNLQRREIMFLVYEEKKENLHLHSAELHKNDNDTKLSRSVT